MAIRTSRIAVELVDRASSVADRVSSRVRNLTRSVTEGGYGGYSTTARLTSAIERNQQALAGARAGVADAVAGYYMLREAIGGPVQAAMDFESAMADVKKVVDFGSPQGLADFENALKDLSTEVPISVAGLAEIAAAAGQAGIAGEELVKFTEASAKIATAFDVTADVAGESMAKMMTGLGLTLDETILLTDAMNHLSNTQASSAEEILDVVRRVGASAKQFGFTATEVSAFGSAMIAAGSESDVAATSFRNMGRALTMGESATARQSDALKALGLDAGQVARDMQEDAVGTTIDVMERISQLPAEMQAAISNDLFGSEARALGPLLTNLDLLKRSLGLVGDESDYAGSAFKEFDSRNNVFQSRLQRFLNRFEYLKIAIGQGLLPVLSDLMDAVEPVIDGLTTFAIQHPKITAGIFAITASLVALRVASSTLRFVGLLGRGGALDLMAFGWNRVGRRIQRAAGANIALQSSLAAMNGVRLGRLGRIRAGLSGIARTAGPLRILSSVVGVISGVIAGLSAGPIAAVLAVVTGLAMAGGWLWRNWDRVSSTLSGIWRSVRERLQPAFETLEPVMDKFAGVGDKVWGAWEKVKELFSGLAGLFVRNTLTEEEKAELEQNAYDATEAMFTKFEDWVQSMAGLATDLYTAGADWITSLWDGAKDKAAEMMEWFTGLPGRIADAVGTLDMSKLRSDGVPEDAVALDPNQSVFGTALPPPPTDGAPDGARRSGGPITAGNSYVVGEDGPEVVTPTRNGYVHPNRSLDAEAGAPRRSERESGGVTVGALHFAPQLSFPNAGPEDARRIAEEAVRLMEEKLRELQRGSFADGVY